MSSTSDARQGLVSLVVPTYNQERYLDQCLASIEAQTWSELEVIVVNDGSTDASSRIAHEHALRDPRIIVIDKPNEGYGASCNRGIEAAHGEWLAIVEPDDYLEPGMYRALVERARGLAAPPDVVRCAYWRVFDEPEAASGERRVTCAYAGRVQPSAEPFAIGDATQLLLHHPAIWAGMYRRSYLADKGIRLLPIPGAGWADNPFMVASLCNTDRVAYVDQPLYCYRENGLEEALSFARKNPLVPLARWQDMMDAAEAVPVTDLRVLSALYLRGINYCRITIDAAGMGASGVADAVRSACERMDAEVLLADKRVAPEDKALFAQVMGMPAPRGDALGHAVYLVQEGAYRLRANGLRETLRTVTAKLASGR